MKVCFGIDISCERPVVVRAEKARGRVSTFAVSESQIKQGANCAGSLSVQESFTRWLETPFGVESKARKVLPTLLDIRLPFPLEDCTYNFVSVGRKPDSVRALAVGATMDAVSARIDQFKRLGLDVQILDHDGLALWSGGVNELPVSESDKENPRIVVNLGASRSTIVIGKGTNFLSAHSVRSDDGARIARLLDVGLKGTAPDKVSWFFGGEAAEKSSAVNAFLALAGERGKCPHETAKDPKEFLARSLAVRGLDARDICNLRVGDYTHPDIRRSERLKRYFPALMVTLAGVILIIANAASAALLEAKEDKLDVSFRKLADGLAGYRVAARGKDALAKVQRKVDERSVEVQPFMMAFDNSITVVIREIMATGNANGLKYDVISVAHSDAKLVDILIKGTAESWNACDKLAAVLRRRGCVISLDRKEAMADERIPFTIRSGAAK